MSLFAKVLDRTEAVFTLAYRLLVLAIMLAILGFLGYCGYIAVAG